MVSADPAWLSAPRDKALYDQELLIRAAFRQKFAAEDRPEAIRATGEAIAMDLDIAVPANIDLVWVARASLHEESLFLSALERVAASFRSSADGAAPPSIDAMVSLASGVAEAMRTSDGSSRARVQHPGRGALTYYRKITRKIN